MAFSPKKKKKNKPEKFCVYDLETLTTLDKAYLAGFFDGKKFKYFESSPLPPDNPDSCVGQFCDWYFDGSKRPPIYAHNGGNFDHIFILSWLLRHRKSAIIELLTVQSSILAMRVKLHGQEYDFRDSFRLLPGTLDAVGQALTGLPKIKVDYETLHLNPDRYRYLDRDCVMLYNSIDRFSTVLSERIGGTVGLTAASTAIQTLQTAYLEKSIENLPTDVDEFIRGGYYGGRCEVFRKLYEKKEPNTRLNYYDVNSMYPWAMSLELPTKLKMWLPVFSGNYEKILQETAFLNCLVEFPFTRYPNLPYRQNGKLIFPIGEFRGTWTTLELRHAIKLGAKIKVVYSAAVFETSKPFTQFVHAMFSLRDKKRADYDPTISLIAKILANSSYGKFGSRKEKEIMHIRPELSDIIDKGMRPMQGPLDLPLFIEDVNLEADYMLPHLSTWITAAGRTRLAEIIQQCEPHAVYYCDTDSVVTTATLEEGTALGELKAEHSDLTRAEFIAPKVYRLTDASGKVVTKAKGFSQFGKGTAAVDFDGLAEGECQECSHFAKVRTFLRGDFGLIVRQKRLLFGDEKRKFFGASELSDPLTVWSELECSKKVKKLKKNRTK